MCTTIKKFPDLRIIDEYEASLVKYQDFIYRMNTLDGML